MEVTMKHASKLRRDLMMDAPMHSRCASRCVISTEHEYTNDSFRWALEAVPAGIVVLDSAGVIVFVNVEIESTFGYARVELIGQRMDKLVPGCAISRIGTGLFLRIGPT
jgi:PAS domain-containing protein